MARIDPETGAITGRVQSLAVPTDLAAGAGALWLGTGHSGAGGNWTDTVYRVVPQTTQIITAVQLPDDANGGDRRYISDGFPQIAVGAGAVWATGGGGVARIDPDTDHLVATAALAERRRELMAAGLTTRAAAFSSRTPGRDVVRLANQESVDLLLVDVVDPRLDADTVVLEQAHATSRCSSAQAGRRARATPSAPPAPIATSPQSSALADGAGAGGALARTLTTVTSGVLKVPRPPAPRGRGGRRR